MEIAAEDSCGQRSARNWNIMRGNGGRQSGFTLFELVVALGVSGVLMAVAIISLKELDDPLKNGSAELASFFKQARAKAVSTTTAYTIVPVSSTRLETQWADKCSDVSQTSDPQLVLELPTGAALTDSSWTLCYNSRGLPDGNLTVEVNDGGGDYRTVEVFLGGAVRVQ